MKCENWTCWHVSQRKFTITLRKFQSDKSRLKILFIPTWLWQAIFKRALRQKLRSKWTNNSTQTPKMKSPAQDPTDFKIFFIIIIVTCKCDNVGNSFEWVYCHYRTVYYFPLWCNFDVGLSVYNEFCTAQKIPGLCQKTSLTVYVILNNYKWFYTDTLNNVILLLTIPK